MPSRECAAAARVREAAQDLQRKRRALLAAQKASTEAIAELQSLGIPLQRLRSPTRARQVVENAPARLAVVPPPPRSGPTDPAAELKSCDDVCHLAIAGGECGAKAAVLLSRSGGTENIPTRYCLLDARRVITSHHPSDFSVNTAYPAGTQERRYDKDRNEQGKVRMIAQSPRPELIYSTSASPLDGVPIVSPTGVALGGNGRSMGVLRHYENGGLVYRDYIRKVAGEFGFTPQQIDAVQWPAIVRVIDVPRKEWPSFVRRLNQGLTQSMDSLAEGVSLARQLDGESLKSLAGGLAGGEVDLGDFLQSRASLPLIAALRRATIITSTNEGRLLRPADGLLTEDGRTLLTRQLGAAVVADADLLELLGPELRAALSRSAPYWLSAASAGGDWDVRPAMLAAAKDLQAARAAGRKVRAWYAQQDIFSPPATRDSPQGQRMLVLLEALGGKPAVFSRIARQFASEAAMFGGSQASMLAPKSPEEAIDDAAQLAGVDMPRALGELGTYRFADQKRK